MSMNRKPSYGNNIAAPKGKHKNKLQSFFEGIKNKHQERKNRDGG